MEEANRGNIVSLLEDTLQLQILQIPDSLAKYLGNEIVN